METDLAVLARRVASIERTLGDAPAGSVASLRTLDRRLSSIVPPELLAAHRTVQSLRAAVPSLDSERSARRARAAAADSVVSDAVAGLEEMRGLQDSIRGAAGPIADIAGSGEMVARTETVAAEAASVCAADDEGLERLLAEYNAAVAGLNARFLRVAARVRAVERARGVTAPEVADAGTEAAAEGVAAGSGDAGKKVGGKGDGKKGDCSVV